MQPYDALWTPEFRDAANFDVVCGVEIVRVHREVMMHRCHAPIPFLGESLVLPNQFPIFAIKIVLSMIYHYGNETFMDLNMWSWDVIRILDFLGADELIRAQDTYTAHVDGIDDVYSDEYESFMIGLPEFPMMRKSWAETVARCKRWMRDGQTQYLVVHVFPKLAPSLLSAIIGAVSRPALFHRSLVPAIDYTYTDAYTMPLEEGSWTIDVFDQMFTVTIGLRTVHDQPDAVTIRIAGQRSSEEFGSMEDAYECVRSEQIRVIAIKADVAWDSVKETLAYEVFDTTVLHAVTVHVPLSANPAYFPPDVKLSFANLTE